MFPVEHSTFPKPGKNPKNPGKMFHGEHFGAVLAPKTAQNAKIAAEVFLLWCSCGIISSKRAPAHPGRQYNTIL